MNNDERKPRLHIHLGGLIVLIILALIFFKVDIKSKINSPQFQKNITYIEELTKNTWQKYVSNPLKIKVKDLFITETNKSLQKVQDNFVNNVLKPVTEKDIENASN